MLIVIYIASVYLVNYSTRPSDIETDTTLAWRRNQQLEASCSLHSTSSQQSIEHNDFYDELVELEGTLHKNFIHHRKKYAIFVQKTPLLEGGHHAIVISDGVNDAITFELTVMSGKASAVIAGGRTIAKVVIFQGNMSKLENYGEVTCTLYELTQTAANVLNSDRQYNWLSNNCQHFCTRFLEAHGLRTYTTDTRKVVTGAAVGAAAAATITLCTIQ